MEWGCDFYFDKDRRVIGNKKANMSPPGVWKKNFPCKNFVSLSLLCRLDMSMSLLSGAKGFFIKWEIKMTSCSQIVW